jgi:hypothetical protein
MSDLEAVHRAWQADDEEQPPDSVYAFPKQKKEPMTDASHVRNALARFRPGSGRVRRGPRSRLCQYRGGRKALMPPFLPDYLSDREIGLVIAYLKHMAGPKQAQ